MILTGALLILGGYGVIHFMSIFKFLSGGYIMPMAICLWGALLQYKTQSYETSQQGNV